MDLYTMIMATLIIVSSLLGMFTVGSRILERRIEKRLNKRMDEMEKEFRELNKGKV